MSLEFMMSGPANLFAWMIFTTCIIGWFGGCLMVLAEVFVEIRLTLRGIPLEERPKESRSLSHYVKRNELD